MSLAAFRLPPGLRRPRGLSLAAPGLLGPELALVALGDGLFWGRPFGLSLPLFCGAAAATAWWLRPGRRGAARAVSAALLLLAALAPAVERPGPLSLAFAFAGTLVSLRLAAGRPGQRSIAADAFAGPRRLLRDLLRRRRLRARLRGRPCARRRAPPAGRSAPWLAWIAPVALTGAFAALLAQANPLISAWISAGIAALPVPSLAGLLCNLPRLLFWLALLCKLWPLVRARRGKFRPAPPAPPCAPPCARPADTWDLGRLADLLLSPAATSRALALLVALLAAQIGLDGAYLWGGLALPDGLTYAAYAHRGAYPLVATALLAAGVALAIRRPGAPAPSRLAGALLLVFLGENVVLVASAMERLSLYVAAYSLTEWRVAAFAWMGLVASGLALIAAQGALGRDGRWLLRANAFALLAVLYGWCFLDVPRLVADYDVAHCAELRGEGPELDVTALVALGPEAVPAVDRYLLGFRAIDRRDRLELWRARSAREVRTSLADWRGWSLAGWRLARYLDTSGVAEPAASPAAPPFGDDES